ncbi:heterokaryon incompatibility protein-domain-containing protein, partial [Pyrenochaeta sp. MPI-SDFR-AT-0127]
YCTLSYRWGPDTHDCILKAPFSGQIDLTFDQMPQTFKDAITTTRALGVRFLWIDALCIVQSSAYGDDADWNAEGSRMGIIYQGAICTIAATCARSADDGFLSKTGCKFIAAENCRIQPQPTEQSQYTFLQPCPPDVYRWVTSSNLNRRGWVQQERALSRRVLHFTEQGIFSECQETTAHCSYGEVSTDSTQFIRCPQRYASILTGSWFDFVSEYSRSQFSKVEDRLIALSSVAKTLQPIFANYEYCAGLWSGSLARGLSWHCASSVTPSIGARASIAPSWSWASVTGYVSFLSTTYCEDLITVLEI